MNEKKTKLPEKARVNIDRGVTIGGVHYPNEKFVDLSKHAPEEPRKLVGEEPEDFEKRHGAWEERQAAYEGQIDEHFERSRLLTPEREAAIKEANKEAKAAAREDAAELRREAREAEALEEEPGKKGKK